MQRLKQLIPDDEGADRYLPWVLAIMMFTAQLAMAAGLALNAAANTWTGQLAGTLTVEVPPGDDAEALAVAAAAALRAEPGVLDARALGRDEIAALLAPWLGDDDTASVLPLPWLVDVRLDQARAPPLPRLARAVERAAPGARIEDHASGLARLLRVVDAARWLSVVTVSLAAAALCLIVVFSTRAALAAHGDVIQLLHLMGAYDRTIAGRFQSHALWLTLRGGMIGVAVTAATLAILFFLLWDLDLPLLSALQLPPRQVALLALLPLPAAALAALTARLTVMRALARLP